MRRRVEARVPELIFPIESNHLGIIFGRKPVVWTDPEQSRGLK